MVVAEVENRPSGSRQNGRGQGEKKIGPKMLKSSILKQQKRNTPQKKAENNHHSCLK